ncbi:DUF4440 domain-containing protein [Galbibacter pacificus]|uniref:DUF4440 domain-containing protein n=1 Tax=Galbibacter pacificus TaxID=2996052 RepID=A0ABT6FQ89_9FLAO|nr:DUF4440 domain-containing protein [Galbibacter pacificus]MDG3582088.1 DUF4440 domain-containing protein [Galbibacter pacificus]MDG3585436.1 DUF4440 domain-containing protein [Galbibacter pacificus]
MKHLLLIAMCIASTTQIRAQETPIFSKGEKAPNVHHTGDVWLNHISSANNTHNYNVVVATFAPNAKLDWHVHPGGQQLLITEGTGYYQERNKPVQIVKQGDVINCGPGVEHWHASTPTTSFAYLAVTANQPTQWLKSISEETYQNINVASVTREEIKELSKKKWQWMADKNVKELTKLFHKDAQFVHMGGAWGTDRELAIIESGGIWYKKADIHEVNVDVIGDTAILLNRITLLAEVGGNEVTNPFMVTEVYKKQNGSWKLANLSFVKLLTNNE